MNNLEKFKSSIKTKSVNKVLDSIEINKRVFTKLYPIKEIPGVDYLTFHITNKDKIIKQFEINTDLKDYLSDNLPKGNILYIDYIEVNEKSRSKGIGTKVVEEIISKSKNIGLSGIYLDSYDCSMEFWERNGFCVDCDQQEEKDGDFSDYHSTYLIL